MLRPDPKLYLDGTGTYTTPLLATSLSFSFAPQLAITWFHYE